MDNRLRVRLYPNSKKDRVVIGEDRYDVFVKDRPEKNLANNKMLELLSASLGLSKKEIKIISGHKRSNKIISF